jgi:hypothetical protein
MSESSLLIIDHVKIDYASWLIVRVPEVPQTVSFIKVGLKPRILLDSERPLMFES